MAAILTRWAGKAVGGHLGSCLPSRGYSTYRGSLGSGASLLEEGLEEKVPQEVGGSESGSALPSPPAASVTFSSPQCPQKRALVLAEPLSAFPTSPHPRPGDPQC